MIKNSLKRFVDKVLDANRLSIEDVRTLQRDVMPDGVESRDECDVLIALDRAIHDKAAAWSAFTIQSVADYVVWTSRPTGIVNRETAQWLTTSLSAGAGPTPVATAIAFEVVRECERADEILVGFVMRSVRGRSAELRHAIDLDLAA